MSLNEFGLSLAYGEVSIDAIPPLLAKQDKALTHAVFEYCVRQLETASPSTQKVICTLLPTNIDTLSPETSILLAKCYRACNPQPPLPQWQRCAKHPEVFNAWFQTEAYRTGDIPSCPHYPEQRYTAIELLPMQHHPKAVSFVSQLIHCSDLRLQLYGCEKLAEAVSALTITPEDALPIVQHLATTLNQGKPNTAQAQALHLGVLQLLTHTWVPEETIARQHIEPFLHHPIANIALASFHVLKHLPGIEALVDTLLTDANVVKTVRLEALNFASTFANAMAEFGQGILNLMEEDPAYYGQTGMECLAHCQNAQALNPNAKSVLPKSYTRRLFTLYLQHPTLPPGALSQAIGSILPQWLKQLKKLSASDASWPCQIAVLKHLNSEPTHHYLLGLLHDTTFKAHWGELIKALGALYYAPAEPRIVALMLPFWEEAKEALRQIGSDTTIDTIITHLESPKRPSSPDDSELLSLLLTLGGEHNTLWENLPLDTINHDVIIRMGASPSAPLETALANRLKNDIEYDTVQALARSGGDIAMDALCPLLLQDDPDILEWAYEAFQYIGRTRREQQHGPWREPGVYFLAEVMITLYHQTERQLFEKQHLLKQLIELEAFHPKIEALVQVALQDPHIEVQALALSIIGLHKLKMIPEMLPYIEHKDIRLRRQALKAVAALNVVAAADKVAQSLYFGNMNIKKEAAEALQQLAGRAQLPHVLHWLRVHDNPGLHDALVPVLYKICPNDVAPIVSNALVSVTNTREQQHLLSLLDNKLSITAVVGIQQSGIAWADTLLKGIAERDIGLLGNERVASLVTALQALGVCVRQLEPFLVREDAYLPQAYSPQEGLEQWRTNKNTLSSNAMLGAIRTYQEKLNPAKVAYLRYHLNDILDKIENEPRSDLKIALLTLLDTVVDKCSTAQKVSIFCSLRSIIRSGKTGSEQSQTILKRYGAINDTRTHQALSPNANAWDIAQKMADDIALNPDTIFDYTDLSVRTTLLKRALKQQMHFELLQFLLQHHPHKVNELRAHWVAPLQIDTLSGLLKAYHEDKHHNTDLAKWIVNIGGPQVAPYLVGFLCGNNETIATAAQEELKRQINSALTQDLQQKFVHATPKVKRRIADVLLALPGRPFEVTYIEAVLKGELGEQKWSFLPVNIEALTRVNLSEQEEEHSEASQLRWVALADRSLGAVKNKIQALIALWRKVTYCEVEQALTQALSHLAGELVLPHVWSDLEQDNWSVLALVGSSTKAGEQLAPLWGKSELGDAALLEFFERAPQLTGSVLAEAIIAHYYRKPNKQLLPLIGKLSAWRSESTALALLPSLHKLLTPSSSELLWHHILQGLEPLAPVPRFNVFTALSKAHDHPLVWQAMAKLVVTKPMGLAAYPAKLEAEVIHLLDARDVLLARGALAFIAQSPTLETMVYFEQGIQHPASSVRTYAHRLIRKHGDRQAYLEATRVLLEDKTPGLQLMAMRILAYASDLPSVKVIVGLMFDKKLEKQAVKALKIYGEAALPVMEQYSNNARPDRREKIRGVMGAIQADH